MLVALGGLIFTFFTEEHKHRNDELHLVRCVRVVSAALGWLHSCWLLLVGWTSPPFPERYNNRNGGLYVVGCIRVDCPWLVAFVSVAFGGLHSPLSSSRIKNGEEHKYMQQTKVIIILNSSKLESKYEKHETI